MTGSAASPDSPNSELTSRAVLSWALYDLANTIFSTNIVSFFLSLWIIDSMGGTDTMWALVNSFSMLGMLVTAPLLGALSDRAGRRLPFLLASTISCVALTGLLGVPGLLGTLILFAFANYAFQAGLIFYDALLPVVSSPANRGRVSGLGVALGYVGSFLGLGMGFVVRTVWGYEWVFRATAVLFLVFSMPIFIWVREPRESAAADKGVDPFGAFRQVFETLRRLGRYPGLRRFLIGRVFYTDAANTLIIFMGIYTVQNIGYSEATTNVLVLVAVAAAAAGGVVWGPVVDRLGPRRTLDFVIWTWIVVLVAAAVIPMFALPRLLFWGVACGVGIALGGTWAADRPYMLLLTPHPKVGEFFGLYSMVGRFSAVVGPVVWALVADELGLGRPASVMVLAFMALIALLVLRGVDEVPGPLSPAE